VRPFVADDLNDELDLVVLFFGETTLIFKL